MAKRDYSLLGPDAERAVATGLAAAQWYHSDIDRKDMKALMKREDQPAIRDTDDPLWRHGPFRRALGVALWPSWWSAPFWLAYGVLYGSAMDSRWHECGHGTAFRTGKYNDWVYQIASFCMVRNPVTWRWSHARHHTDTVIVGRDPEIVAMRPPALFRIVPQFLWHSRCRQRLEADAPECDGQARRGGNHLHPGKRTSQGCAKSREFGC